MVNEINVIGAGLAGSECAYQLSKMGYKVNLFEMKKIKKTPAQKKEYFAELVCSNSLKSKDLTNACGLLKEELFLLDSLVIKTARETAVPSGSALSVDRDLFSSKITEVLKKIDNINIVDKEIEHIDVQNPTVIATGPLTSDLLCEELKNLFGEDFLSFYDACSPIIYADSIDMSKVFFADRYGDKAENVGDYLNCGLNKEEYEKFYFNLLNAKTADLKDFEKNVFEGCMAVEIMAKRGKDSLRFGPLKPVGIVNPKTNEKYYAVVQLRKENINSSAFNMVGFQTNLIPAEQKKVFAMIPGLENAEYARYGAMHKNIFINAPKILNKYSQCIKYPNVFIAGQLSGVEGYVESVASGLVCALNISKYLKKEELIDFTTYTAIGSLMNYLANASPINFQPMNSNYAIMSSAGIDVKDKKLKRELIAKKSMEIINKIKETI